jgi:Na+:H+ antiporter, NhaA family
MRMTSPFQRRARAGLGNRILRPIVEFTQLEASSGILLALCTVVALFWANSAWSASYTNLWQTPVAVGIGSSGLSKPLLLWINDGLMAVFFFLVGLEIKRELIIGELSQWRQAALPIAAAVGGMLVPAAIYYALNAGGPGERGWGIPMATDIAFALAALTLVGSRVPLALKVFLAALAIVDDIGAVLVIAIFYSSHIDWLMLGCAGITFAGLLALNRFGARAPIWYAAAGLLMWVLFLKSGVHATVAGVLVAATVPARIRMNAGEFVDEGRTLLDVVEAAGPADEVVVVSEERQSAVRTLERACEDVQMPIERMENMLHPWVTFGIVPLFALANAGISFSGVDAGFFLGSVPLGVILGLLMGKPLGIVLFTWLALRMRLCRLPANVDMRQILGVGVLGGIGFTMSLFVAELAFDAPAQLTSAKVGILAASLLAGAVGWLLLRTAPGRSMRAK